MRFFETYPPSTVVVGAVLFVAVVLGGPRLALVVAAMLGAGYGARCLDRL